MNADERRCRGDRTRHLLCSVFLSGFICVHPWLLCSSAFAAGIEPIGVLGNSGITGAGLLRVGGDAPGGAALAPDGTLYLSGGDAINRVSLAGAMIERHALEPAGARVRGFAFAMLSDKLYFPGELPGKKAALFELPLRPGSVARALAVAIPPREYENEPLVLAAQPLDGRLVLALRPKGAADKRLAVYLLDPAAAALPAPAFRAEGTFPAGVAVDTQRQVIYVGTGATLVACTPDGKLLPGFPVPCMKTPALPTAFRGRVSFAAGALWDTAWYGFLSRHDRAGAGSPGRILEWSHDLDYPGQVLALRDAAAGSDADPLLLAASEPDAYYFALWQRRGELQLLRRIGCLPAITSLGLAPDGTVAVGTARSQLAWHWDDASDAPPRYADIHTATTPVCFRGDTLFALGAQYHVKDGQNRKGPVPIVFPRRSNGRNEAARGPAVPMQQPVGLSVQARDGGRGTLYVSDAATKQVWRKAILLDHPLNDLGGAKWEAIALEGATLADPTDLVALADGRLLIADAGRVLLLTPQGARYTVTWQFDRWGEAAAQRFGPRLRLAADGPWLLVSDSDRQRLLWLDWTQRQVLGEFAAVDQPGDDLYHLAQPGQVALQQDRAVVADRGNQRVVKLRLRP